MKNKKSNQGFEFHYCEFSSFQRQYFISREVFCSRKRKQRWESRAKLKIQRKREEKFKNLDFPKKQVKFLSLSVDKLVSN